MFTVDMKLNCYASSLTTEMLPVSCMIIKGNAIVNPPLLYTKKFEENFPSVLEK